MWLVLAGPGLVASAWTLPSTFAIEHVGNVGQGACEITGSAALAVYLVVGWLVSVLAWFVLVAQAVSASPRSET